MLVSKLIKFTFVITALVELMWTKVSFYDVC